MISFIYDTKCVRGSTFNPSIRYSTVLCPSSTTAVITTGSVTFAAQTGLLLTIGVTRVRASVLLPIDDSSVFVEGVVTAYSAGHITINVDTFGGLMGSSYSGWRLTASVDLTGGSILAEMRFSNASCSGRARPPIAIGIIIATPPSKGVFTMYFNPTQTAALQVGNYQYKVLFLPPASSDRNLVVSGTISVVDE